MDTFYELQQHYACEFLETRGRFTRVTTEEPSESAWHCNECESLDVDPYEDWCGVCDEDEESEWPF